MQIKKVPAQPAGATKAFVPKPTTQARPTTGEAKIRTTQAQTHERAFTPKPTNQPRPTPKSPAKKP